MPSRLRDVNSDDQVEQLRFTVLVVIAGSVLLLIVEMAFWPNANLFVLALMNVVLLVALSRLIWPLIERGSHALINTIGASNGGDPHTFTYSEVESLVTRGQFVEAADMYRAIAEERPKDADVWIRLGDVLGSCLKDTDSAIAAYEAARRATPTPGQASRITNSLIDLYRTAGNSLGLRAELLHYAKLHHGTAAGDKAREAARQIARAELDDQQQ